MGKPEKKRWSGPVEAQAFALAATQQGLITVEQLLSLGASRRTISRRIHQKLWKRCLPGVLRLLPPPRSEWHAMAKGACLWLGEDAFASHAAAGWLHGLDGFDDEPPVHVSVRRRHHNLRVPDGSGIVIHCVKDVPEDAITETDGIPVSKPWRALLEIASSEAEDTADAALDSALRHKRTNLADLKQKIEGVRRRGLPGLSRLDKLIEERDASPSKRKDSENERWFFKHVIRAYGLPEPIHNFRVNDANGKLVAKTDAGYPRWGISIELHSKKHHTSIRKVKEDAARQNRLVLAGLTPLIFWWEDVRYRPEEVAVQIQAAIDRATATLAA